jgi:hypothetical protein
MRLWIDDLRLPPAGWTWARTSRAAVLFLEKYKAIGREIEAISFDHDLGGDDTSRPVVLWMCENDFWPDQCFVHSMNNVGREWLSGMINRYGPGVS